MTKSPFAADTNKRGGASKAGGGKVICFESRVPDRGDPSTCTRRQADFFEAADGKGGGGGAVARVPARQRRKSRGVGRIYGAVTSPSEAEHGSGGACLRGITAAATARLPPREHTQNDGRLPGTGTSTMRRGVRLCCSRTVPVQYTRTYAVYGTVRETTTKYDSYSGQRG